GANLLASAAGMVVGIDIDNAAVLHATVRYSKPNLQFVAGSVTEIPARDGSFDVVTCFEAIEHIEDQSGLLREVKRILDPNGLFIVSTPNKTAYHEANPFHVKELSPEEFEAMLRTCFSNVQFLGQRIHSQSSIWRLEHGVNNGSVREFVMQRGPSEFDIAA